MGVTPTGGSPYTCPTATADYIGTEISGDFVANDCRVTKLKRQRGSAGNLRASQIYSNNSQNGKLTTMNVAEYSKLTSKNCSNSSSILLINNSSTTPLALSLARGGVDQFLQQKQDDSSNVFQMNTNTNTTTTATPSTIHPLLDIFYNRQSNLNLMNYIGFNNTDSNGNNNLDLNPIAQQFSTIDNFAHNFQQAQKFNNFSDQNLNIRLATAAAVAAAASTNNGITAAVAAAFLQQVAAAAESQQQENSITKQLTSMINDPQLPTSSWHSQTIIHHPYNNNLRAWSTNNKRYMSAKKLDELKNS